MSDKNQIIDQIRAAQALLGHKVLAASTLQRLSLAKLREQLEMALGDGLCVLDDGTVAPVEVGEEQVVAALRAEQAQLDAEPCVTVPVDAPVAPSTPAAPVKRAANHLFGVTDVITVVKHVTKHRPTSAAGQRAALLRSGMSVGEFVQAVGGDKRARRTIRKALRRGEITVHAAQ